MRKVTAIFAEFEKREPNPTTELWYRNNFELLIAVMLSAQATDISVNKVTPKLFALAPTPAAMVELGLERVKELIRTIGLFNTKASNIVKTCEKLLIDFAGVVPMQREQLESLPGVGRKTANVVLNTAFGHATIAVDTHIFRVARRIGLSDADTRLGVEHDLERIIPEVYKKNAHHWLILHGRYVCKARKPECSNCCIQKWCEYEFKILD